MSPKVFQCNSIRRPSGQRFIEVKCKEDAGDATTERESFRYVVAASHVVDANHVVGASHVQF